MQLDLLPSLSGTLTRVPLDQHDATKVAPDPLAPRVSGGLSASSAHGLQVGRRHGGLLTLGLVAWAASVGTLAQATSQPLVAYNDPSMEAAVFNDIFKVVRKVILNDMPNLCARYGRALGGASRSGAQVSWYMYNAHGAASRQGPQHPVGEPVRSLAAGHWWASGVCRDDEQSHRVLGHLLAQPPGIVPRVFSFADEDDGVWTRFLNHSSEFSVVGMTLANAFGVPISRKGKEHITVLPWRPSFIHEPNPRPQVSDASWLRNFGAFHTVQSVAPSAFVTTTEHFARFHGTAGQQAFIDHQLELGFAVAILRMEDGTHLMVVAPPLPRMLETFERWGETYQGRAAIWMPDPQAVAAFRHAPDLPGDASPGLAIAGAAGSLAMIGAGLCMHSRPGKSEATSTTSDDSGQGSSSSDDDRKVKVRAGAQGGATESDPSHWKTQQELAQLAQARKLRRQEKLRLREQDGRPFGGQLDRSHRQRPKTQAADQGAPPPVLPAPPPGSDSDDSPERVRTFKSQKAMRQALKQRGIKAVGGRTAGSHGTLVNTSGAKHKFATSGLKDPGKKRDLEQNLSSYMASSEARAAAARTDRGGD